MNEHSLRLRTAVVVLLVLALSGCRGQRGLSPKPPPRMYKITGANLHGVATWGADMVWAVGAYGSIHHSGDGGKTWVRQVSKTDNLLCAVEFVSDRVGWAAGIYGTLLHTRDGGATWSAQDSGTSEHLFDLDFVSQTSGWAVGSMGTVLHTADGGESWAPQRRPEDASFNSVCFVDNDTGWVAGEFARIYHTRDGGATWVQQKPPTLFVNEDDPWGDVPLALFGVRFVDKKRGWVVGMEGVLLRTVDGGATWEDLGQALGVREPLYSVQLRGDLGWIVGGGGVYLMSRDRGATWRLVEDAIKTRFWLHDVTVAASGRLWVVGARGAVVTSDDGGTAWNMLSGLTYDVPEFGLADF